MLITRAQLSKELNCTTKWVDDCRKSGRLPDYEPGTKLFDREKALNAWTEWQIEANDEDEDSQEYLASILRLWRARVELSRQKLAAIWRSTIITQAAELGYSNHRDSILSNLQQWAEESSSRAEKLLSRADISRILTDACHSAIDRLNQGSGGEIEEPRQAQSRDDTSEDLDVKKAIERAKTAYNHSEAEIREMKAKVVSGELLMLADVISIASERVAVVRTNFLALPARSVNSIAGRTKDEILVKLRDEVARLMDNLPTWNVADFRPADSVIAGLKSDLREEPKGDLQPDNKINSKVTFHGV